MAVRRPQPVFPDTLPALVSLQNEWLQMRQDACVKVDQLKQILEFLPDEKQPQNSATALIETQHLISELDFLLLQIGLQIQRKTQTKPSLRQSFRRMLHSFKIFLKALSLQSERDG